MQTCALAIFDLGDVVFRTDPLAPFRAWAEIGARRAQDLADRFTVDQHCHDFETGSVSNEAFFRHVCEMLDIELSYAEFVAGWNSIYREPHAEVVACLEALAGKTPCVALTNTNAVHNEAWPGIYRELLSNFDRLYVSSDMGLRKPDRACYEHVLADMGVAAEAAVFFDDKLANVEGATAVGIAAVLVDRPATVVQALEEHGLI